MLDVRNLHAGYGRMEILHGLDLHVDAEEIVSLIGANGAGKTTTLRALAGVVTPTQGTVELEGTPLQALRPDQIVRNGVVHVAQDRELFGPLQVSENLEMGAYTQPRSSIRESLDRVFELFPIAGRAPDAEGRDDVRRAAADVGDRASADGAPRLLTLDEPSVGLAPNLAPAGAARRSPASGRPESPS